MTNKEAANRLARIFNKYCNTHDEDNRCDHECNLCNRCKDCYDREAYDMAIKALEEAEKYRWHDLRKKLDNFPTASGHKVRICIEGKTWCNENEKRYCDGFIGYGDMQWYTTDNEYMRKAETIHDNRISEAYEVIAWREIKPFEEEE